MGSDAAACYLLSTYVDSNIAADGPEHSAAGPYAGGKGGGGVRGFGDLESVVMHLVWDHDGPVTVRELFDELRQERVIAYTTVMSTMDNLHRKGWLDRVKHGKAYRYTATASREEYSARLMREALAGGGDTEVILSHFVAEMGGPESELLREVVSRLAGRRRR
jgi:predicted transcriptional regulator